MASTNNQEESKRLEIPVAAPDVSKDAASNLVIQEIPSLEVTQVQEAPPVQIDEPEMEVFLPEPVATQDIPAAVPEPSEAS